MVIALGMEFITFVPLFGVQNSKNFIFELSLLSL
jgi:hypothetical protein